MAQSDGLSQSICRTWRIADICSSLSVKRPSPTLCSASVSPWSKLETHYMRECARNVTANITRRVHVQILTPHKSWGNHALVLVPRLSLTCTKACMGCGVVCKSRSALASFPGRAGEGKTAWYRLFAHAMHGLQVLHSVCIRDHACINQPVGAKVEFL